MYNLFPICAGNIFLITVSKFRIFKFAESSSSGARVQINRIGMKIREGFMYALDFRCYFIITYCNVFHSK